MKRICETYDLPTPSGKFQALAALLLGLCLTGCGYSLNHRLKPSFAAPRGIFIPVFVNATEETGAERVFTNALIRELQSRGEAVIGSRESGAAELRGVIESISYTPTAFTNNGYEGLNPLRRLPFEIGLNVSVSLRLIDPKTGRELWGGTFTGFRRVEAPVDRTYDFQEPSSLGLRTQSLIESRYMDIARDISRDSYDAMVELF